MSVQSVFTNGFLSKTQSKKLFIYREHIDVIEIFGDNILYTCLNYTNNIYVKNYMHCCLLRLNSHKNNGKVFTYWLCITYKYIILVHNRK